MVNREELVEHYIILRKEGKDYTSIRKELLALGISKEEVSEIIDSIDKEFLKSLTSTGLTPKNKAVLRVLIGYLMVTLSLIYLLLFCIGFIEYLFFIILGIKLVLGSYLLITGKRKLRELRTNKSLYDRKYAKINYDVIKWL